MILKSGITLYHGSYTKIEKINLSNCLDGKDFGSGFYLTSDYEQAAKFIKTSIVKAKKNKLIEENVILGYVNVFRFEKICDISIFDFKKPNKKWLHYVAGNRKKGIFEEELNELQEYDIVSGKIANDATNRVITAYINNVYGEPGSHFADRTAISLLLPNKLSNQIYFKTQAAVSCLKFVKVIEVQL